MSYGALSRTSAPGVDGETWQSYGANLEENLQDLSGRLRRGAYRAKPVQRVYIPKADGKERPIGMPTLEDKIVQRATVEVLNAADDCGEGCCVALLALKLGDATEGTFPDASS